MMDIKSTPISFRRLAAILADLVALSNLIRSLGPERKPLNFVWKVADIITEIVVDILDTIPNNLAFPRTEFGTRSFGWIATKLTWFSRQSARFIATFWRTINTSMIPTARFEKLSALGTGMRWRLYLSQAVASMRTVLTLPFPFGKTAIWWLGKRLVAMETLLSEFEHVYKYTGKRLVLQGNT